MDGGGGFGGRVMPPDVLAISLPQWLALFGEHAPDAGEALSADDQLAVVNQIHAEKGLPPVQKRPRTFAEAGCIRAAGGKGR